MTLVATRDVVSKCCEDGLHMWREGAGQDFVEGRQHNFGALDCYIDPNFFSRCRKQADEP